MTLQSLLFILTISYSLSLIENSLTLLKELSLIDLK